MEILLWIVFGAIVGWIASMIMGTSGQQGVLLDIVVGIVGAVLGGWLMGLMGEPGVSGFNFYSFVVALIGAVALLAIVRLVRRAS
ncbi:MAG: GlsB/YeaQ/YmgE family stress response membrane protein [Candidatus Pacebacteria bacterium]|nr:GlsB/YeaQ/YmgE family stress response membrane protein [Candidatus Paceibacterota bacterium]